MWVIQRFDDEVVVENIFVADIERILDLIFGTEHDGGGDLIFDGPVIADHMEETNFGLLDIPEAKKHDINAFLVDNLDGFVGRICDEKAVEMPLNQTHKGF